MSAASAALAPMHSAHLVGPYDWDQALMPRAEYDARLARLFDICRTLDLAGIIVHGNPRDNGALAYVSGLVPRMGMPAWAFLAPNAKPRLALAGLPTPRQTWIEDMRLVRDLKSEVAGWLGEIGISASSRIGLCGAAALTEGAWQRLSAGVGAAQLVDDRSGLLAALRETKTPREHALMAKACVALADAVAALRRHGDEGSRTAAIAAKRAAYAAGAQDVVVLTSLENDGVPLPLDGTSDLVCDPSHGWVAVRWAGYWAQALVTISSRSHEAEKIADATLTGMLADMRPGIDLASIVAAAARLPSPYRPHELTQSDVISGIGLSLVELPFAGAPGALVSGGIYSVRVGVAGTAQAFASAMVAIDDDGADILWRSTPGDRA